MNETARDSRATAGMGALVVVLMLIAIPPFLCIELHSDVILFDVYARNIQKGGVPYRDWCETNLPGMAWLQWGIRSAVGWSSEALRGIDLLVIGSVIVILARWNRSVPWSARLGWIAALAVFYVGSSEWSHVQRDPWMLLPALLALSMRRFSLDRPSWIRSIGEGMLWGVAFWIKPFVAVPGLLVWLTSVRLKRLDSRASWRSMALDAVAILSGGVIVGGTGIAWMIARGAWPSFVEMATDWNREYFAFDATGGKRGLMILAFISRSFPWVLVHLAAVPCALRDMIRSREPSRALIAAMYLGWLGQAVLLQHFFDYVYVPAIMLGFAVLLGQATGAPMVRKGFALFLVICVMIRLPILLGDRLQVWPQCVSEGSSPAVRDRMSRLHKVQWVELQGIADALKSQGVADGELTCFPMPTSALYRELDVESATRYQFLQNNWLTFRQHRPRIEQDVHASRQRFMVIDTRWEGAPRSGPWEQRIIHRSGRYALLELTGPDTPEWLHQFVD